MNIIEVNDKAGLQKFVQLPYRLYRDDPLWVAPLRSEQWSQFDVARNPMLEHCSYCLLLAVDGPRVLGRISAFTDRLALAHWQQPIGLFGSFECIQDPSVAHALLGAAHDWLRNRGMQTMRGPWSFASQEWGLVVEGVSPSPVILAPYNPPWYNDHFLSFGMEKAKDLIVYLADENQGYHIPQRILKLTDRIRERYGVRVRQVDMNNLEQEVTVMVQLANQTICDNWGFYPVTEAEGKAMARDLKQIVKPAGLLIAEDPDGRPVGFAMALPDINLLIKGLNGRLLPFGWLKLLLGLPRLDQYRLWALGIVSEYQGKGVDCLLYRSLHENLHNGRIRLEINYVLEDNNRMNNALQKLEVKPSRRYRVYEKAISK